MRPALLAVAVLAVLSGCDRPAEPAAAVTVKDARLVLPIIAGNPGAAYFTVRNDTASEAEIVDVSIAGAGRTELHDMQGGSMNAMATMPVARGATVTLAPGHKHLMVYDIDAKLAPGATTRITLKVGDGQTVTAPLAVVAPVSDAAHGH